MMDIYAFIFDFLKMTFALVALLAILFDYMYHKDMRLILYAYLAFFISTMFLFMFDFYGDDYYKVLFRLLGVVLAGILFALGCYSANKRIGSVKDAANKKLMEAFKK